jgi:histidinol-phosphate aminotransferase
VVDEAYLEFEGVGSMAGELDEFPNIIVLRTLSKALGMAGARCGAVIGRPEVIELLGRVRMPYAIPTAVTNAVRHALSPAALQALPERVNRIVHQRAILARQLAGLAGVDRVWPSVANFLLVRFHDANAARAAIAAAGIHVRDLAAGSHTAGCLRISIGTEAQNAALVTALAGLTT